MHNMHGHLTAIVVRIAYRYVQTNVYNWAMVYIHYRLHARTAMDMLQEIISRWEMLELTGLGIDCKGV